MRATLGTALLLMGGCAAAAQPVPSEPDAAQPGVLAPAQEPSGMLTVSDVQLHAPPTFVVYGDMRFTDPAETDASNPRARLALVGRIATEPVDAVFLTGDVPWHGGDPRDYQQLTLETAPWRELQMRVYPVLGNHEFQGCVEAACLASWWQAFPALRGQRWYAVALGSRLRVLALDSNAPLVPGSEQRTWLERELQSLPPQVRFVMLLLHHPPVADEGVLVVRANERSLASYLASVAPRSAARLVVIAGHVHNYERFERGGVVYVISGGGGARPHPVIRGWADRYRTKGFPNFHYIRFTLHGGRLSAEMIRLEDPAADAPHTWAVRDRFEVLAKAP
jgi:3',5'-cyclic AMP phosphodiesterase CpdA